MTTAYITDTRFNIHTLTGHSEYAGRLTAIHDVLNEHDLPRQMLALTPGQATREQLAAVHTDEYLNLLAWTETQHGLMLGSDTYVLPESFGVAKLAAGTAICGVDAVLNGQADNALVCLRPPGHHATSGMGMGFCLLANVAIAARHAQQARQLKRIMIVDYDVHHGNGTQEIFYEDADVLYLSTHQYPWYPGTGAINETGSGAGVGATINVPLPSGTGDIGFAHIFERIVWKAAQRFRPELMLVSAGFDAHWADPLGRLQLSLTGYDHLTRELIRMAEALCDGKIVFVLEGGYNLTSLSHAVANVAFALLHQSQALDPLGPAKSPESDVQPIIEKVAQAHRL